MTEIEKEEKLSNRISKGTKLIGVSFAVISFLILMVFAIYYMPNHPVFSATVAIISTLIISTVWVIAMIGYSSELLLKQLENMDK